MNNNTVYKSQRVRIIKFDKCLIASIIDCIHYEYWRVGNAFSIAKVQVLLLMQFY